jgi:hypothetical protein
MGSGHQLWLRIAASLPFVTVRLLSGHQLWLRIAVSLGRAGGREFGHQLWLRMRSSSGSRCAGRGRRFTSCGCARSSPWWAGGAGGRGFTSCGCAPGSPWSMCGVAMAFTSCGCAPGSPSSSGGDRAVDSPVVVAHVSPPWMGAVRSNHQLWLRMTASSSRCSFSTRRTSRDVGVDRGQSNCRSARGGPGLSRTCRSNGSGLVLHTYASFRRVSVRGAAHPAYLTDPEVGS